MLSWEETGGGAWVAMGDLRHRPLAHKHKVGRDKHAFHSFSLFPCMCEWTGPGLVTWTWLQATGRPPEHTHTSFFVSHQLQHTHSVSFPACAVRVKNPPLAPNANTPMLKPGTRHTPFFLCILHHPTPLSSVIPSSAADNWKIFQKWKQAPKLVCLSFWSL